MLKELEHHAFCCHMAFLVLGAQEFDYFKDSITIWVSVSPRRVAFR